MLFPIKSDVIGKENAKIFKLRPDNRNDENASHQIVELESTSKLNASIDNNEDYPYFFKISFLESNQK